MRLVYFAWIRERIGKPEEEIELPASIVTVADLLAWLRLRGEPYANALAHDPSVRVAIDQEHVGDRTAQVRGAREIALFPPMTGG